MRIGIFGGSFDPVHLGHLWIAEAALESLHLDQVRWIPAATSPLKPGGPVATDQQRLDMVRLAVSGCPQYEVDDREIRRGQISYTVDTLAEIRQELPEAELFLIIGSDSLATIRLWHQPERLLQLAIPAVVRRAGEQPIDFTVLEGLAPADRIEAVIKHLVPMPLIELSSQELRARVAQGRSIRFRVPHAVAALITTNELYREGSG